jgi:small subunit ribosomal protein S16
LIYLRPLTKTLIFSIIPPTAYYLFLAINHMLSIRLTRIGKRKQPLYRFIVTEKSRDPWGKSLEILGNYNPHTSPATTVLKTDRVKYWLSKGAQTTDTVWNLFCDLKLVQGDKRKKVMISKRRKEKIAKKQAA